MNNQSKFIIMFLTVMALLASAAVANPIVQNVQDVISDESGALNFTISSTQADNVSNSPVNFGLCYYGSDQQCDPLDISNNRAEARVGQTIASIVSASDTSVEFRWTPDANQGGSSYRFKVRASDGDSEDSENFTITVRDVAPKLSIPESVLVGGPNQKRSNPSHEDDDDQEVRKSVNIRITNQGGETVNNLIVESITLGLEASQASASPLTLENLDVSASEVIFDKTTINSGETATATVNFRIPEGLSAVDENGKEKEWHVATITFAALRTQANQGSDSKIKATTNVKMQAENLLTINKARVKISSGDSSDGESVDNGDNVEDVKPGDTVDIELEIESGFDDNPDENVDINDVSVTIENAGLDVEEEETVSDLDPKETDTLDVQFELEDDVERGDEELSIKLIGEDDFGASHGEEWTITLEVERAAHEIDIKELKLDPSTASCQPDTELRVDIRNIGRDDEDRVYVNVISPGLLFEQKSERIEIDEGDEKTRSFIIPVPENTPSGNHKVIVETFYDGSTRSQTETTLLNKVDCGASKNILQPTPTKTTKPKSTKETEQEVIVQEIASIGPKTDEELKENFFDSPTFLLLLIVGYIVVIGFGVTIIMTLAKK